MTDIVTTDDESAVAIGKKLKGLESSLGSETIESLIDEEDRYWHLMRTLVRPWLGRGSSKDVAGRDSGFPHEQYAALR